MTPRQTLLEVIWRLGSVDAQHLVLTQRDLARWDEELRAAMTASGVLTDATPAAEVICPACEEEHLEQVQWFDDVRRVAHAAIWCPQYGRVEISQDALETKKIVPASFVNEVSRALAATETSELVTGRLWRVLVPGSDVLLLRGRQGPASAEIDRGMTSESGVVVGFSRDDTRSPRDLDLTELVGWQDGSLTMNRERLGAVKRTGIDPPPVRRYCFRPDNGTWVIAFEGEALRGVKPVLGLTDIHYLLRHPNEAIPVADVTPVGTVEAGLPAVDAETIATLRRFSSRGSLDADVEKYLRQSVKLGGGPRTSLSSLNKAANTVRNRMDRAIRQLAERHAGLGNHLDAAIRRGLVLSYRPTVEVDWEL